MTEDTPGASHPTLSLGACGVNRIGTSRLIGEIPALISLCISSGWTLGARAVFARGSNRRRPRACVDSGAALRPLFAAQLDADGRNQSQTSRKYLSLCFGESQDLASQILCSKLLSHSLPEWQPRRESQEQRCDVWRSRECCLSSYLASFPLGRRTNRSRVSLAQAPQPNASWRRSFEPFPVPTTSASTCAN